MNKILTVSLLAILLAALSSLADSIGPDCRGGHCPASAHILNDSAAGTAQNRYAVTLATAASQRAPRATGGFSAEGNRTLLPMPEPGGLLLFGTGFSARPAWCAAI